ncbi:hypothetical protein Hanom_Chr12g01099851 [Helianthus anomalus]
MLHFQSLFSPKSWLLVLPFVDMFRVFLFGLLRCLKVGLFRSLSPSSSIRNSASTLLLFFLFLRLKQLSISRSASTMFKRVGSVSD